MRKILSLVAVLVLAPSIALAQAGAQVGSGQIWGNSTASRAPGKSETVTAVLDRALGSTRGAILERGASGWGAVGPGSTAGLAWISGGAGADPAYGILGLSGGGCNAALVASNGGILYSTASACAILAGTATARLPLLSGASAAPVWGAYTLPASVTSGGIACFTSTTVQSSSGLLSANAVLLGGGAGVCPSSMGSLGTTTTVLHGNAGGAPTFGAVVSADLSITATNCTNQFVSAISTGGVGTCSTVSIGQVGGLGTGVATMLGNAVSAASGPTTTIASGTAALGTGAISSATCATVVTATATNAATTDVLLAGFNGDPTAVTGYIPSTAGMLTIIAYPTANTANFKVCNNTASSITPGAITLNWRVVR